MIGEKQSGHSCQMHWMNVNKPVRMLKCAFFGEKKVWRDKVVDGETENANKSKASVHMCPREQVEGVQR